MDTCIYTCISDPGDWERGKEGTVPAKKSMLPYPNGIYMYPKGRSTLCYPTVPYCYSTLLFWPVLYLNWRWESQLITPHKLSGVSIIPQPNTSFYTGATGAPMIYMATGHTDLGLDSSLQIIAHCYRERLFVQWRYSFSLSCLSWTCQSRPVSTRLYKNSRNSLWRNTQAVMADRHEKVRHTGGCHCGAVKFQVWAPATLDLLDCKWDEAMLRCTG